MNTEYDAVLFDSDGVLVEPTDLDTLRAAVREAFEAFGVEAPAFEDVDALHHVTPGDVERVCGVYGIDPAPFWRRRDDAAARRQRAALERGEKRAYADLGVVRELGLPIGVVSNNQQGTIDAVVEQFGLADAVETNYGREHSLAGLRRKKPQPHYLREALAALGADHALYVGDSQKDVVAADRAGIDSAFVRRPHRASVALDPEPTIEVGDLRELRSRLAAE